VDLKNFTLGGVLDSNFKDAQQKAYELFEQNYPEIVNKTYIINAPTIFQLVWKACSWFLSKKAVSKIRFLGGDYLEVLDKEIGLENLPTSIGGKNPIPINDYENFWDKEIKLSYKEKRVNLVN
jgi:hypothetical protein